MPDLYSPIRDDGPIVAPAIDVVGLTANEDCDLCERGDPGRHPDHSDGPLIAALAARAKGDALVGWTAGQALERLEVSLEVAAIAPGFAEHGPPSPSVLSARRAAARQLVDILLPSAPEQPRRPTLLSKLWTTLRRHFCNHAGATAHRVPGPAELVFRRRCCRCGAEWTEVG